MSGNIEKFKEEIIPIMIKYGYMFVDVGTPGIIAIQTSVRSLVSTNGINMWRKSI